MDMRFIERLASKLCVRNDIAIQKVSEYIRLLELKTASSNGNALNMSETCRVVICIDLAASHVGLMVEKEDVVKLAGVTRKLYVNFYHMVEKLLGLNQYLSIKDICIQLRVNEVASVAQKIMDKYMLQHKGGCNDSPVLVAEHPMYSAVAIYTACKHLKVKVSRTHLLDLSHIKKQEFDRLVRDLEKHVAPILKKGTKLNLQQELNEKVDHLKETVESGNSESLNSEEMESYEDWKLRILKQAKK